MSPQLAHLAFFDELAGAEHYGQDPAVLAGLLSLRVLDNWFAFGTDAVGPDALGATAARQFVGCLAEKSAMRMALLRLLNELQQVRGEKVERVLAALLGYGIALQVAGKLTLAADVFETVLRTGNEDDNDDVATNAYLRLGYCRRMVGSLAPAEESYERAGNLARWRKDRTAFLRSRIGLANVYMMRGNMPAADDLLGSVVRSCRAKAFRPIRVFALMDQAAVAKQRADFTRAIRLFHEAMTLTDREDQREHILSDLGATLLSMGRLAAAADALHILEATALTEIGRSAAMVNLLALAARQADRPAFDRYRAELAAAKLSPEFRANAYIEAARGWKEFGEIERAREELNRACRLTEAHQLNRSLIEAEQLLNELHVPAKVRRTEPLAAPVAADDVERELRRLALAIER